MWRTEMTGVDQTEVKRIVADYEEILARDRKVVKELTDCIIREVPRHKWPRSVQLLCAIAVEEVLGTGIKERSEEPVPKEEEPIPELRAAVDWDEQPLGEFPDTHLAKKLGVSGTAVRKARKRRGIPPCCAKKVRKGQNYPGCKTGINWDEQPLGRVRDKDLAVKLGVDPSSVRSARKVRGIAAYGRDPRKEDLAEKFNKALSEMKEPVPEPDAPESDIDLKIHWGWTLEELEARKEETELTPAYIPEATNLIHIHRCPVCSKETRCSESGCDPQLERLDGLLQMYVTCQKCIEESQKESTGVMIQVTTSMKVR